MQLHAGSGQRNLLARRAAAVDPDRVAALEGEAPALEPCMENARVATVGDLFVASAQRPPPLAVKMGCALEETSIGPILRTGAKRMTGVPGIYAAGDAA